MTDLLKQILVSVAVAFVVYGSARYWGADERWAAAIGAGVGTVVAGRWNRNR